MAYFLKAIRRVSGDEGDPSARGEFRLPPVRIASPEKLLAKGPLTVASVPVPPITPPKNAVTTLSASDSVLLEIPFPAELHGDQVWHYTDAAGALSIIQSGTLRASSISSMNDEYEYQHGLSLLGQLMGEVDESRYVSASQKRFLAAVVGRATDAADSEPLFVLSASTAQASLAQWRAYGGATPHALVLDSAQPLAVVSQEASATSLDVPPAWRRVVYLPNEQRRLLLRALAYAAYLAPKVTAAEDDVSQAARVIISAIAHCKDPSFIEEQEVRLLVSAPTQSAVLFRASRFGITPYVDLTGADEPMEQTRPSPGVLPISGLMVGPFLGREAAGKGAVTLVKGSTYATRTTVALSPSGLR